MQTTPYPAAQQNEAQCAAPGGPNLVAPNGVAGAGAFFLLDRGAVSITGAEGLWTRVGPFSRITSATANAGGTPLFAWRHPAVRLGWRLAAD
ncbi:unnamed protein product [Pleuronectes platessa]|uniref:Uncharacterized protein n=1 Tax=Pleuronectes platessa TaxID=8262 RepID=A0A9N7US54_PLEPL|nr:unnamed protein product [Pleuronectes platessa]